MLARSAIEGVMRVAVVAMVGLTFANRAGSQSTRHSPAVCSGVYFSSQAERVNHDCCGAARETPTTAGHRRRQQTRSCGGVPATCESQQCASTYTEFFESCRAQLQETPSFADYDRLYGECSRLTHDCEPVYLGESVGMQRVFEWDDDTEGCTLRTAEVEKFCPDPLSMAACLEHIAATQPEPEPEQEPEGCQQVFLGPDMGFVDVMERNANGQCTLSITMLSVVCSGPMFQTCIDFLHSSGEGPGDPGDPDYAAKHPGGGH